MSEEQTEEREILWSLVRSIMCMWLKSIHWTVIGCWPRNGYISVCVSVYIYILACFSNVAGSVLSYNPFYFCLPDGR